MKKNVFLSLEEVLDIHDWQIEHFGGASGLRDAGLLDSALAVPSSTFGGAYLHPTVIDMAAAYLFHLVENHPFVDGNKRVGAMSAAVFLDLNGQELTANDDEFTAMVLAVASGKMDKVEVVAFFKHHTAPVRFHS